MSNVIDFRTRQPKGADAPAPDRVPTFVVEFFDDPQFPVRYKGAELNADFLRGAANNMKAALMGLLEIAYEKDPDPAQRLRMVAYLFEDGNAFIDAYNPSGTDEAKAFAWMERCVPAIAEEIKRMKEKACTPTR